MHPDIVIELARQRVAEQIEQAQRPFASTGDRAETTPPHGPTLRTRLGWTLVRWGHRLAPPPAASRTTDVRRAPRRAATMGA